MSKSEGLWAYYKGEFYGRYFDDANPKLDHVTWFQEIGLSDYGPEFDRILRGRMLRDPEQDCMVLTWYGFTRLPNSVYESVRRFFKAEGKHVIEKQAFDNWNEVQTPADWA